MALRELLLQFAAFNDFIGQAWVRALLLLDQLSLLTGVSILGHSRKALLNGENFWKLRYSKFTSWRYFAAKIFPVLVILSWPDYRTLCYQSSKKLY